MTEQRAREIATRLVQDSGIANAGVKIAAFIPGGRSDPAMPPIEDVCVVHFQYPPVDERFAELREGVDQSDVIIVAVDPETEKAVIRWTL